MAVKVVSERVHGPARRAIRKGLHGFNDASVGYTTIKPLSLSVRDRGRIVGGLAAESYYGWMFVSLLWLGGLFFLAGTLIAGWPAVAVSAARTIAALPRTQTVGELVASET